MKMLIIGVSCRPYKDKKTGEDCNSLILYGAKNNANCYGKATEDIFIAGSSPLYGTVLKAVNGIPSELIGYFIDVDRNNKGYIENVELLEHSEDAVMWGF